MKRQILDITRTVSRVGKGFPTGIDRVERAYIQEFIDRFEKPLFLAKLKDDFAVIDVKSMAKFVNAEFGEKLIGNIGVRDAFRFKLPKQQRLARSFIRKQAGSQFKINELEKKFSQDFPDGFEYTNIGHSNLHSDFLSCLKPAGCTKIRVMIHDMIPLDFPQYCKEKTPREFKEKMSAVANTADVIICNSEYTKTRVQAYYSQMSATVSYIVAYLGVNPSFKIQEKRKNKPLSFVILGTIEARKNHSLLLDAWEELFKRIPIEQMPVLHIVGKRGWENNAFFDRLKASDLYGDKIIEHNLMDDAQLNDLLSSATALLFPSFAEGYGLPAIEAQAVGIPVICSDIPVFKELLGKAASFLPSDQSGPWVDKLLKLVAKNAAAREKLTKSLQDVEIPSWSAHFCHVLGAKI